MLYDLVSSPFISKALDILNITDNAAETFNFLLAEELQGIEITFPIAGFEGTLSTGRFYEWLGESFGLPEQVVTAATAAAEIEVFFGAYTPGFGGE